MFNKTGLTWAVAITALCVVSGAIPGASQDGETRGGDTTEQRFVVTGVPDIVVKNGTDGRTTLRAYDGNEVRVRTTKEGRGMDALEVRIHQDGDRISIETHRESGLWFSWGRSPRVHIEVEAPRRSDIDARNDDGPLTISGFEGRLSLVVDDGDLFVSDTSGELIVRGDDGELDIDDVRGAVDVRTDDGDLRLGGILTVVRASTDDGDLDIRAEPGSRMEQDWSLHSDDGGVLLTLPEDFAADLTVLADDGDIEIEPAITMQGRVSRNRISGELNGGGYELRVTTDDGRVTIRQ